MTSAGFRATLQRVDWTIVSTSGVTALAALGGAWLGVLGQERRAVEARKAALEDQIQMHRRQAVIDGWDAWRSEMPAHFQIQERMSAEDSISSQEGIHTMSTVMITGGLVARIGDEPLIDAYGEFRRVLGETQPGDGFEQLAEAGKEVTQRLGQLLREVETQRV